MENSIIVFETRICPKPLMPAGAKSDTHVAFTPVEQTENQQWSACRYKEGKPTVFPSKDQTSISPNNPWSNAWSNIYRDYCYYYGNPEIGYRRKRERIVKITGIMLDFDSHSTKDMPLEQISKILLSDEFYAEVPYSKIVMTGNGYQVHLPILVNIGTDSAERAEKFKKYRVSISALMAYFHERWGLNPDESCKDPNRLHRVAGTWNTKSVQNTNDLTARKKVEIVRSKNVETNITHEFIHRIIDKYTPKEIETKLRQQNETTDAQEVKEALNHINPATLNYGDWLKIGMSLKSWDEEKGLTLWDEWSQKDPERYDSNEIDNKWGSFSSDGEITLGTLFHMSISNGWKRPPKTFVPTLPVVCLPGNGVKITTAGKELGKLLADTGIMYRRGKVVVRLQENDYGQKGLSNVTTDEACSLFENVALLKTIKKQDVAPTIASHEQAARILACSDFLGQLPRITIVTNCPVLTEDSNGNLREITGYDSASGILSYGKAAEDVQLTEAVALLKTLLNDFQFASENDYARALGTLISPALILGKLICGRSPIDTTEADQPQSGKGYRNKLLCAIYNETMANVNSKSDGMGGLEESFDTALIRGKPFISLENIRGKINSQKIESFMTEDTYQARIPYSPNVDIDPKRHIILMTSNRAEATKDLTERMVMVEIRKQSDDYIFQEFPEGDILQHIKANQPKYLGAVHAIVKAWHKAGKPKEKVSINNTFAEWFCVIEWIVTHLLGGKSIVVGQKEAMRRITNPLMGWMRDLALAVKASKKTGRELRASELLDIIENTGLDIPFIRETYDTTVDEERTKVLQIIGRKLNSVFADGCITIDDFKIERIKRHDDIRDRDINSYIFNQNNPITIPAAASSPGSSPEGPPEESLISPEAPEGSNSVLENLFF